MAQRNTPLTPRRMSVKRRLLIGTLVAGAAVGTYYVVSYLLMSHDDRPPIIISNGPVRFSIDYVGIPEGPGPGEFKADFWGDDWRHDHSRQPPQVFDVTVQNAVSCDNPSQPFRTTELQVEYTDGSTLRALKVYVGGLFGKHLKIDFNGETPALLSPQALTVGGEPSRITRVKIGPGNGGGPACTFDGKTTPRIIVAQRAH